MSHKIAVASGKGGTGKTSVATNLYRLISEQYSEDVFLMDCDVEEPNDILFFPQASRGSETPVLQEVPSINVSKCTYCRKCVDYCEFNAILVLPPVKYAEINPSLCHSCGACQVACESFAILVNAHPIVTGTHFQEEFIDALVKGQTIVEYNAQSTVAKTLESVWEKLCS